jgi:hypothetical protein
MANPRYQCHACPGRNTKNQLRGSNGVCIYCKTPQKHTAWIGGGKKALGQLLRVPAEEYQEVMTIAEAMGVEPGDLVTLALRLRLAHWTGSQDPQDEVRKDQMLFKLMKP